MTAVLETKDLSSGYHGHPFVRDLNITVEAGEVVALLGPNGAGKTTTLLAVSGELRALSGEVHFLGNKRVDPLHKRAADGLAFVTEERSVFMQMTTAENFRVGRVDADECLAIFPELRKLMNRPAGLLSGGEQQMVTLARAITRKPKLLLIDELSLGLAPLVVKRLLQVVRSAAKDNGIGVLLVEQKVESALAVADRVYVLRDGKVALQGPSDEVKTRVRELEESYLSARPARHPRIERDL
ncbi:ATP-binding cassette domain-containing protein [Pseudarthrobacter sp. fls2-241-R2A-168]|uniref:ABC transporter ATP-binding protein n=1 Tax=Pseudarthrobacter sp. fls2-241-R2A-168 TaxID=3040304 RepID=UPI0025555C82|nr:ATP-binding cassette domain-containing protein [Pseudarthrobacter sp. fls2-241-R2A-168]